MRTLHLTFKILVLSIFPLGWVASESIFVLEGDYYFALNLLAFIAAGVLIWSLRGEFRRSIHIWIIFILYITGYFVKYYLLCYMSTHMEANGFFLRASYPHEVDFLDNEKFLLNYFELVTEVMVCFAVTVLLIPRFNFSRYLYSPTYKIESHVSNKFMRKWDIFLWAIIIFSLLTVAVAWNFGIGTPSGATNTEPQLPFRLAGVVSVFINIVIPVVFLIIILFTERYAIMRINQRAVLAYISFGILVGIITTSKAALISVLVSLLLLWLITGQITQGRINFLSTMFPIMALFSIILSIFRTVGINNPEISVIDLLAMGFETICSIAVGQESMSFSQFLGLFGVLLRINGADSLFNILNYSPAFSWLRSFDLLLSSQFTVSDVYSTEVLGLSLQAGTAFSPSLLGYFYLIFPTSIGVCIAFVAYVLFWHGLFSQVVKFKLKIEPVMLSLLSITLAFFSSEGTLESMPQRIAILFIIILFFEWLVRRLPILNYRIVS